MTWNGKLTIACSDGRKIVRSVEVKSGDALGKEAKAVANRKGMFDGTREDGVYYPPASIISVSFKRIEKAGDK